MTGTNPMLLLQRLTGDAPDATCPLDDVHAFLGRFVAYPSDHAHVAHTLWIAHTHLMDAWESTPRIAFLSPEPASGKTRALEATELLVPNPVEAVNVTPAYLFRKVGHEDGPPTVLFDEIDTVFGPKAKDNEEVRGLLNAGHRRGAVAGRCVVRGKIVETEEIPAYCAVAIAGLGEIPDTILSRAVVIRMRRRGPQERVEAYRRRVVIGEGERLAARLAAWADTIRDDVTNAWPEMPATIEDRDSDVWEPLLAVADAAGGDWPERARRSGVALVAASKAGTPSLGIRLLADLRDVFQGEDALSTEDVLTGLLAIDEAPWNEIARGKPLNPRGLAQRLKQYGVGSRNIRLDGAVLKGYRTDDLDDAWSRYLGPPPLDSATSATPLQDDPIPPESDDPLADVDFGDDGDDTPTCYDCNGPAPADGMHRCLSCRGVIAPEPDTTEPTRPCRHCGGTGQITTSMNSTTSQGSCPACDGSGAVVARERGQLDGGTAVIAQHCAVMGRLETPVRSFRVDEVTPWAANHPDSVSVSFVEPRKRRRAYVTMKGDSTRYLTIESAGRVLYDSRADVPCDMDKWDETNLRFQTNRGFTTIKMGAN